MSHVTVKRSSPLWFPMVFAIVRNLTSFHPFLPRDYCCFRFYWHVAWVSYVGKVL